jgi:hypothetical protein
MIRLIKMRRITMRLYKRVHAEVAKNKKRRGPADRQVIKLKNLKSIG